MTTISKTSKRAQKLIENAVAIKVYALSDNFSGRPITDRPVIWGGPVVDNRFTQLKSVTVTEFLRHELDSMKSTKLRDNGNGTFTLDVHSNLWYEFESYA
jgi:hypothetical protein